MGGLELAIIVTYDLTPKEHDLLEKELAGISQEAVQNCIFVCISSSSSLCKPHGYHSVSNNHTC